MTLSAALGATASHAYVPTGSDFRISNVSGDGDASRVGTDSAVAYNAENNEYLVVYRADALTTDNEFEIFGRRVSAAGATLGPDFRISNVGADADATRDAEAPAVTYNPASDQYLVVWSGDVQADEEHEVYGQRVSAAGVPDAQGDFRITQVGTDGDGNRDAVAPAVAADPGGNEYLVAFQADDLVTEGREEIYGRRVSGAGVPLDTHFRISDGGPDSDPTFDATMPAVVFNPAADGYLVVWQGEGLPTEGVTEIWAQRVTSAGVATGGDRRVSNRGSDTDAARDAGMPAIAFDPSSNQYSVVWRDDGWGVDNEFEIFGQRLGPGGAEQGGDFRISNLASDGDATRSAGAPAIAHGIGENLVTWHGDGLATGGELEIFGQRVSTNGGQIGADTRISSAGVDADPMRDAEDPGLAFASVPNQYLTTWTADDLATDDEYEIFGRRLAPAPVAAPPKRSYELPKKKCKKKKKKKKGKSAVTAKKKKKKKKCK